MGTVSQGSTKPASTNYWGLIALIGLVATVGGMILPQLLPDETPVVEKKAKESASAPGDLHYTPPEVPETPSTRSMFMRLGGMTVVVLVLGVGVMLCGKYWMRGFAHGGSPNGKLALVETLQLGNRCCLHLIQMSSRQVLVGADATGIKTVVPLSDDFDSCLSDSDQAPPSQANAA